MASARDQMNIVRSKLDAVRNQIVQLRVQEKLLMDLLSEMGLDDATSIKAKPDRKRSPSIKPLVLDIMKEAGDKGATSSEVDFIVRAQVPTVAKDTVGSVLSRLKSDGALIYEGERYYEKRFSQVLRSERSVN